MACNYPMWRIPFDKYPSLVLSVFPEAVKREHNGGIIINRDEYEVLCKQRPIFKDLCQEIPCGKCIACRLEYSRQWANRCMQEARCHASNLFVTLTYDTPYLKYHHYLNMDTGELEYRPMLQPNDLTKFLKDFRRYFEYHYDHHGIRFFASGEYGDENARPHFHLLLFNCDLVDKKFWFERQEGDTNVVHYQSQILKDIWGKGITSVSELNWNSAAYTARYVLKKQKGKSVEEQRKAQRFMIDGQIYSGEELQLRLDDPKKSPTDWQHEFTRCSRRPGIGREYYENHKHEMYATDEMFVLMKDGVRVCKPAKYYDSLYDIEYPEDMERIKKERVERAKMNSLQKSLKTDLTDEEQRINREERLKKAIKNLPRPVD